MDLSMENKVKKNAVVLLSGGLDSATCLAIAKSQGFDCYCLSLDYHQRHIAELHAAKNVANIMGAFYGLSGLAVFMAIIISSIINIIIAHDYSGSAFKVILFNIGLGLVMGIFVGAITGLFGWAIGYVWAAIYNLIVTKTGGIKIELTKEEEKEEGDSKIENK